MLNSIKNKVYLASSPHLFAQLFNIRGKLRGTGISCFFVESTQSYVVSDKTVTRLASRKNQVMMYADGFSRRANSLFKTYLLDQLEFPTDALIVDCGANVGDFYLALVTNIIQSFEYIAYEPSPLDFTCLAYNVKSIKGEVRLRQNALWNESEKLVFFLDVESASSSIIEPKTFNSRTMVSAVRLDEELFSTVFLIKVEAEGAEPEVLQGAIKLLPKTHYVVVDVGPERGKFEEVTRDAVVQFMNHQGFEIMRESDGNRRVVLFKNKRNLTLSK